MKQTIQLLTDPHDLGNPHIFPTRLQETSASLDTLDACETGLERRSRKVRAKRITTQLELATVTVESRFSQVSFVGLEVLDIV
jgi:hypothetical protein